MILTTNLLQKKSMMFQKCTK